MKLVRKTQLHFQEAQSEKVYEIALFEMPGADTERYIVSVRYSHRGATLKESQKTPAPVDLARAEKVFDSVVVAKRNQGYVIPGATVKPSARTSVNLGRRIMLEKNPAFRARQIWRLPPEKDPDMAFIIAGYLGHDVWRYDYSILWTLGRIGSSQNIAMIRPYLRHSNPVLASLAREVTLALTEPDAQQQVYLDLTGEDALLTPESLTQQVAEFCALPPMAAAEQPINECLKQAYLQSIFHPAIRQALIAVLPQIPFAPGAFQGLRYLLKMSEFRLDAEIYALLNLRLEFSRAYFTRNWKYHYSPDAGRMDVSRELASGQARLAHSQKTHQYLVSRCWRTLRQLGAAGNLYYTDMAAQFLLGYSDAEHAGKAKCVEGYQYDEDWNRVVTQVRHYDEYSKCRVLNAIIRTQHPGYQKNARGFWFFQPEIDDDGRGEAFPHLWDQVPERLLQIATATHCQPVSDFAVRAMEDNVSFCQSLSVDALIPLALKPYVSSQQFALRELASRAVREPFSESALLRLLASDAPAVTAFAITQLDQIRDFQNATAFLASLLCLDSEPLRQWLNSAALASKLAYLDHARLLQDCVRQFGETDLSQHQHLDFVFDWLAQHCSRVFSGLALPQVESLIQCGCPATMWLGCRLLDAMPIGYDAISPETLKIIHGAESEAIQAFSISLLKKLTPDVMATRMDDLLSLLSQCSASAQEAIFSVLITAIQSRPVHRDKVFLHVIRQLHDRELAQPLQHRINDFLRQHFESELSQNHHEALWLLATARSEMAHSLAATALESALGRVLASSPVLSDDQWFTLLFSSTAALRALARAYFERDPEAMRTRSDQLLSVLESRWPDTQAFGFTYCEQHMQREDWPADQIIAVCDSVQEPVQQFGRRLMQSYFDAADGRQYLLQLSQHPSPEVECFVSELLPDYAAGDEAVTVALKPYFLSVLSRVNRGRQAKDRVLHFLREQVVMTPQTLEMVCDLLTRLSLTSVHKDKAEYIKLMMTLKQQHADVALPAQLRQRSIRQLTECKE